MRIAPRAIPLNTTSCKSLGAGFSYTRHDYTHPIVQRPGGAVQHAAAGQRRRCNTQLQASASAAAAAADASLQVSLKLLGLCASVGWAISTNRLPLATPEIMSKLSYQLANPSLLFTKCAMTINAGADGAALIGVPLLALAIILTGHVLGLIGTRLAGLDPPRPSEPSSTALPGVPAGYGAIVTVACGFSNCFTMPILYITTMFPSETSSVIAFLALFFLVWDPLFWTLGYRTILDSINCSLPSAKLPLLQRVLAKAKQLVNPPLCAVLAGIAFGWTGLLPLLQARAAAAETLATSLAGPDPTATQAVAAHLLIKPVYATLLACLKAAWELMDLLGSATLPLGAMIMASSVLSNSFRKQAAAATTSSTTKLGGNDDSSAGPAGSMRRAADTALATATLHTATTATATATTAAALATATLHTATTATATATTATTATALAEPKLSPPPAPSGSGLLLELLRPVHAVEWRGLLVTCAVKYLLLPTLGLGLIKAMASVGLLPATPVCFLSLLLQCAMPPAQALAIVVQLQPATQPLAPFVGRLLLQTYIVSLPAVFFWLPVFNFVAGLG